MIGEQAKRCGHNFKPSDCPYTPCGYKEALAELEALRAQVARLTEALEKMSCACKSHYKTICPQCGGSLRPVTRPADSILNEDQFDSVRAGDWYCTNCKGNEARSGYKYWWDRDLQKNTDVCIRCTAIANSTTQSAREWLEARIAEAVQVERERYARIADAIQKDAERTGESPNTAIGARIVAATIREDL